MRCANCGENVDSTKSYCPHCGAKQENREKAVRERGRQKRFYWLVGVGLLLLCCIMVIHFTLLYRSDPERLVFQLETAVKEQNVKQFIDLLKKDNPHLSWTEENAKRFLQYINEEADVHQMFAELGKQAHNPEGYHLFSPVTDRNGNDLFILAKGEKKFGIYQQYSIEVIPFRLLVSCNLDHVHVKIDQKEKTLSDANEKYKIGLFFPGTYKMTATYQSDYTTIRKNFTLDFSEAHKNELDYEAEMEASFISITSNVEEAELFVNGKPTGKTIHEIDSFGPIDENGSVTLHAEYQNKNGRIKTDEVTVSGADEEADLEFNNMEIEALHWDKIVQDGESYYNSTIKWFMDDYLSKAVSSYNEGDFSIIEPYLDENGPIFKELQKYIQHVVSEGIKENLVDVQVTNCKWSDEGITILTQEEYDIYYNDGTAKKKKFTSEYLLKRVGDEYKIHSLINTTVLSSEDL
ncbi:zinc ribbon domain-containing protein [Geobacillus icigianus]|uniref:zinc ribbon domain-containing protein n=1 Tax=Geobacillus TaxID=129337 RepID=UPI00053A810D|nr:MULTISPECIES: zinc ribbon domain-containing protein [Geobacillus]